MPCEFAVIEVWGQRNEAVSGEVVADIDDAGVKPPPFLNHDDAWTRPALGGCEVSGCISAWSRKTDVRAHGPRVAKRASAVRQERDASVEGYFKKNVAVVTTRPPMLWEPDPNAHSRLAEFTAFCENATGLQFATYNEFWEWSIADGLERFWELLWQWCEIEASEPYSQVLSTRVMPGAKWFAGAKLNYAHHALRHLEDDAEVLVGISQSRARQSMSGGELRAEVSRVRSGLISLGVGHGDRVAGYLPNVCEAIIAFLATASLGAIWTSCAPEFGVGAVLDRFGQVEPKVLFAVDGYRYGRHDVDRSDEIGRLRAGLPSVTSTVVVRHLGSAPSTESSSSGVIEWNELGNDESDELMIDDVEFDHPLYILYSSGTTGLPKPIVHGHGNIILEHLKVLALHSDMGLSDRFMWFTTTGWMMWNYLVSGLLTGASLVLFDGDPASDGPDTLWKVVAEEGVTWFGGGAPWFSACRRAGLQPAERFDLTQVRAIGATGAPLPPDAFRWIYEEVSATALLSPISGGTDICSAFVGGNPLSAVREGEIPAPYLGCAIAAWNESGEPVVNEQGELVVTQPMPSMPVGFWGDADGSRYRSSYFEFFPGVWRHGDWVTFTEDRSCVISGRSDATLNRGGVRVGTAEIYRVVESVEGVADSLVVHLEAPGADDPGVLVLFVAHDGNGDEDDVVKSIRATVREELSPRHVPDEVHFIEVIPTTLSGKKLELPVKKILRGAQPDDVASRDSLKDPSALDPIVAIADTRN